MMAMFINEPKVNNNISSLIKIIIPASVEFQFHRLQNTPRKWNRLYTTANPTNISITAKFITRYVLRLRRLRFLIKTVTVQRFNVTRFNATDSARPTVIQDMHSDKDNISKL